MLNEVVLVPDVELVFELSNEIERLLLLSSEVVIDKLGKTDTLTETVLDLVPLPDPRPLPLLLLIVAEDV